MLIYSRLIYQGPSKQKKKRNLFSSIAQVQKIHKLRKTKNSKNTRGSIDEKRKDFGDENRKDRALNIHTEGRRASRYTWAKLDPGNKKYQTWEEVKLHIRLQRKIKQDMNNKN